MSDTATLRKLPIKVLKARAASHGITVPAGHKGKKDTWIAAIQQAVKPSIVCYLTGS